MYINISKRNILEVVDEESLQIACVRYLRMTDLTFTSNGLPEFLDDDDKRIRACSRGYLIGSPDLVILNPNEKFNSLSIELKSPTGFGTISKSQKLVLDSLEDECNSYCAVINSLPEFVEIVTKYTYNLIN